jgi:hypothetical protein
MTARFTTSCSAVALQQLWVPAAWALLRAAARLSRRGRGLALVAPMVSSLEINQRGSLQTIIDGFRNEGLGGSLENR